MIGSRSVLTLFLFALGLLLRPGFAFAAEGPIKVECSTRDAHCKDVSFAEASSSAQSNRISTCKSPARPEPQSAPTDRQGKLRQFMALLDGGGCVTTLSQYVPCDTHQNPPFWTTVEQMHAEDEFKKAMARASSGELIDAGKKIVEILQPNGNEHHYAFCKVKQVKGSEGPPFDCETMAIVTPAKTLIRAAHDLKMCEVSAFFALDGASIEISFKVITGIDGMKFVASLSDMLKDGLDLSYEQSSVRDADGKLSSASFSAIAPIRESKILAGGLRESFDLDLWMERETGGFSIRGHTKPMICRTASGNIVEYHGLNDGQKQQYATTLNRAISSAIAKACSSFTQIDDGTLSCK
ncbi:MAG: hypothetical protein P4M07_28685 [Xanthobacteraceae bacterium]|nr:hypothetical protein [Xanthobacteraceae bacterium]